MPDPKEQIKHQMFPGNAEFITEHRQITEKPEKLREVSKAHKRSVAATLSDYQQRYSKGDEAMARAYLTGAYTIAVVVCILKFTL